MRKHEWQRVYQCKACKDINGVNVEVCPACGSDSPKERRVGRWVSTTTAWQMICLLANRGYWELKELSDKGVKNDRQYNNDWFRSDIQ